MDRYAVFGNPINHSKSPFIHTLFARQTQQLLTYEKIEAPVDDFVGSIRRFCRGRKGGKCYCAIQRASFSVSRSAVSACETCWCCKHIKVN